MSVIPTSACIYGQWERGEVRQKLGISPLHKVLLYVGRIAKEKNVGFLFKSVALAIEKDPEIRFWLVGDGPYREECLKLARSFGIGDKVRFAGFVPRDQVDQYYSAADLFIFSSMTETQGLVVNEAMAHGLPALVVQGGGAGSSVQNGVNGYLRANDPHLFSKTILDVLDHDSLYLSLSVAAKKTSRHYTVEEMARKVLSIYKSSIEESYFNKKGFEKIKIAWLDDGEILSMRKIEDKYYQHHVRLFDDGEIRGHFEMTPESHMIKHLFSIDMVPSILLEKLVKELRYTYAA